MAVPSGQDVPVRKEHPWDVTGQFSSPTPSRVAHDIVELRHIWALEAFKESENGSLDDLVVQGSDEEPPSGYSVTKYSDETVAAFDAMTSAWAKK